MNKRGTPNNRPAWSRNENNSLGSPGPLDALLGRDVNGSNESQARSASPTLFRLAHKPSTGFTSGASAESYATVNQARWSVSQARTARLAWRAGCPTPG
jgi:hypothetical protein